MRARIRVSEGNRVWEGGREGAVAKGFSPRCRRRRLQRRLQRRRRLRLPDPDGRFYCQFIGVRCRRRRRQGESAAVDAQERSTELVLGLRESPSLGWGVEL